MISKERAIPSPGPGEVLIRTRVSLVSPGTELTVLGAGENGGGLGAEWRKLQQYPYVAGYSNVGVVIGAGDAESEVWIGRRVDSHTSHAAYTVCKVAELRAVPDGVSDSAAALATLAEVVMNGLRRSASMGELLARLRAALRRSTRTDEEPVVTTDDFSIDLAAKRVEQNGADVHLTPLEWGIVEVLVRNPGRLVSQRQLLQEVWGPQYERETNYLRLYLAQIRRKLEPDPSQPRYFVTEPGMGYRFEG